MSPTPTPLDYFHALPVEKQEELFWTLFRQFADNNVDVGAFPLRDGNVLLGYFVHPHSREADLLYPPLPPDSPWKDLEDLDWDDVLTMDEVKNLTAEVLSEIRSRSPAASAAATSGGDHG